jgi:hypothetical protein
MPFLRANPEIFGYYHRAKYGRPRQYAASVVEARMPYRYHAGNVLQASEKILDDYEGM